MLQKKLLDEQTIVIDEVVKLVAAAPQWCQVLGVQLHEDIVKNFVREAQEIDGHDERLPTMGEAE